VEVVAEREREAPRGPLGEVGRRRQGRQGRTRGRRERRSRAARLFPAPVLGAFPLEEEERRRDHAAPLEPDVLAPLIPVLPPA
jgi:hypothetical protein